MRKLPIYHFGKPVLGFNFYFSRIYTHGVDVYDGKVHLIPQYLQVSCSFNHSLHYSLKHQVFKKISRATHKIMAYQLI